MKLILFILILCLLYILNLKKDFFNTKKNIALCFTIRNCEKYLPYIFKNIELLKTLNYFIKILVL